MAIRYSGGPQNRDLLFLSGTRDHRADYIFSDPKVLADDGLLRVRRGSKKLWNFIRENSFLPNVSEYITLVGFAGVIMVDNRRVDSALISALGERWRLETNTFHMSFGEVTITLLDVEVLWGLKVDGYEVERV
ncbi:protein MAINTENANCE OF MERISTEMS-like [Helianthus annuus]|uniref:protein MAINTENANCE OF MERISTEMS-like n=1 Tax=Helianthus annuus TaxID=4232 RepID=UPI000B902EF2|nr:protein MAINTENANCE OF MERISTEMS-like [Helianthus annuus]